MTSTTRGRGRPKGSEKDDGQVLTAIADLVLINPKLRPTTAMRRVRPKAADADIRRWQTKWKARKETLLAGAGVRAADAQRRHREDRTIERTKANIAAIGALHRTPSMLAARGIELGAAMKALDAYHKSPIMRALEELHNNPTIRLMREIENSSALRFTRENQKRISDLIRLGYL